MAPQWVRRSTLSHGTVMTGWFKHISIHESRSATILAGIIVSILIAGCGSSRSVVFHSGGTPSDFPGLTVSQILERLPRTPADFSELYAETSVSLSSPRESGRFSTRIAYREGDSMLVRVRVQLGIEAARVLVTGDSAYVYDRIHNEVVIGSPEAIAAVLPGAVFGTDLVQQVLDFIQPDPGIDWILHSDTLRYHLTSPDSTLRIDIDPGLWRVVHVEQRDSSGMVIEQRWYTDFRMYNQHMLPRRMILSRPPEDTRLSMVLRKMDTDPDRLLFDLGLKDDTRRIYLHR